MITKGTGFDYLSPEIDSFMLSLITETNSQGIAERLGSLLGRPVLIEDKFFRILGKFLMDPDDLAFTKPQLTDPFIKEFVLKIQEQKSPVVMPPLPQYGVSQSRTVFPIVTGDALHGYLHIFDKKNPPVISAEDRTIITKVLLALSIKNLIEDAEIQTREIILGNLYRKLIFKQYDSEKVIQETATVLNLDLTRPTWLIIANVEGPVPNIDKLKAIKSFLFERDIEATVICLQEEYFLILIAEGNKQIKKVTIISRSHHLIEHIVKCYSETQCYITFGRKCLQSGDYYKSYSEALKALDYLKHSISKNQVLSFDSLGIIGLVTLPEDVDQMLSFAELILKPLLEYEEHTPSMQLLQTLDCFLKNDCQFKKTANDLYVHANTLRYRIEKIQEICQLDLNDAEVKFKLYLALKIFNLKETLTK
ncbi:PucR family transcriptional regulator [Paradesulfitobacterium ferrireducens]|uniref:PucR family transcriptional regulator n=1 Tax=Paradesulfitobacterium ferrireducens TaxID=2816476 RepID=UPI001A8E542F|nr:helix-turn-helix domain-containing protein [Paradesulfitobacterium ferrireducens]